MIDFNQLINTAIANTIELAVREQLTPYILRIQELEQRFNDFTTNVNSALENNVSTQIDDQALADAVSTALDDKMDSIVESVAERIDLADAMADFIRNEVTISIDTI